MFQLTASPAVHNDVIEAKTALDAKTLGDARSPQPICAADDAADSVEDAGRVHIGGGMMHF